MTLLLQLMPSGAGPCFRATSFIPLILVTSGLEVLIFDAKTAKVYFESVEIVHKYVDDLKYMPLSRRVFA